MTQSKTFQEIVEQNRAVIKEFEKVEQKPWGIEGSMIELAKQVGDLAKHVMVYEKYYLPSRENRDVYKTTKNEIADELTDLFFMTVRIADHYHIDLEEALIKVRENDIKALEKEKSA
ncbi:MAG: MazG-like family protein [Patescibacteria group bacterium]